MKGIIVRVFGVGLMVLGLFSFLNGQTFTIILGLLLMLGGVILVVNPSLLIFKKS